MNLPVCRQVIITDDDPVVQHLLSSVLKHAGFEVTGLLSGGQCLRYFDECEAGKHGPPALLFLDLQLPDVCGADVLVALKQRGFTFPIALLSAQSKEEAIAAFPSAAQADAFLSKPFPPDQAVAVARELMGK